jgi:hypothetical protein
MANLFTSELIQPTENPVEILINRVSLDAQVKLEVSKFSALDELVEVIIPPTTYVENGGCPEDKTRIRVFLTEGQVAAGEKIQVKLDN